MNSRSIIVDHDGQCGLGRRADGILIHSGMVYEINNTVEETLLHEACHTSLTDYNFSAEWKAAQHAGNTFISSMPATILNEKTSPKVMSPI